MKFIKNDQGVVLLTTLMLTLITLAISMVMLYMVLQNTTMSGAQKRYKTVLDAAVGGVDIAAMDVMPYLRTFSDIPNGQTFLINMQGAMNLASFAFNPTAGYDACLQAKLTKRDWSAACPVGSDSTNAKVQPDFTYTLQSQLGGSGYRVYTKIVSTTPGPPRCNPCLDGKSTDEQSDDVLGAPALYRIEVTSERVANPVERSNLSVLYAY